MKTTLLLLMIWLFAGHCYGQSTKQDVIIKTDGTRISCRVLGIGTKVIKYQRLNSKKVLFINKSLVRKVLSGTVTEVPIVEPPPGPPPGVPPGGGNRYGQQSQPPVQPPPSVPVLAPARKFSVQVNALPMYMLGNQTWASLDTGEGHTIGMGGSGQFDYWLGNSISVGAEIGYLTWKTQVDMVNSKGETPYYTYTTNATQLTGLAHVRFLLIDRIYFMPQGGISLTRAGYDDEFGSYAYSGTQVCYGGALGYLFKLGRTVNLDTGLFYRHATASKTIENEYGLTSMGYVGLRLGLGFSH